MEFEFTGIFHVSTGDLEEMVKLVKDGYSPENAFDDVVSGWDDFEYYSASYVKEDVIKEIKKRLDKPKQL